MARDDSQSDTSPDSDENRDRRIEETGEGDEGGATQGRCPPCIDRYSGYLQVAETKDDDPQLENITPVETVELRVSDAGVVFGPQGENETQAAPDGNETVTPAPPAPDPEMEVSPDFYFDPVGIRLDPGDTVEFLAREEFHIVSAFHSRLFGYQQRVPQGVSGFVSPLVLKGDSWFYRFDESGVYDLMCPLHQGIGMVMRIVVVEEGAQSVPEGYPQAGGDETAPSPISQAVLDAPELAPQNIVDQGAVQWTELTVEEAAQPFGLREL